MSTERRFNIDQDLTYEGEWINNDTKYSSTKVVLLSTYTVYESVGSPAYQTPVFQGTKSECEQWVKNL
jgi:hypothetical protein